MLLKTSKRNKSREENIAPRSHACSLFGTIFVDRLAILLRYMHVGLFLDLAITQNFSEVLFCLNRVTTPHSSAILRDSILPCSW